MSQPTRRRRFRIALLGVAVAALALGALPAANAEGGADSPWYEAVEPQTPDSELNVTGEPHRGTDADGDVVGYVDAHTHMFMDLGMGGHAVCGSTFSPEGIADALQDCPNHQVSLLENLTNTESESPVAAHDPIGWPTFKDWPTYSSFTHQQMYYRWVERAWRGGQRVMVNDMVSNPGLCPIIPVVSLTPNTYDCDDMNTVRRQIEATYDLQDFVDQQFGGPGKGWYRVVTNPEQAREVVEDGKLAVVLGVEVSEPFGCKAPLGVAACTRADIDAGLDELKAKGVSSMFLCHKFDNALCGVRYDEGTTGLLVNAGQFVTTGRFWNPKTCKPGEVPDNTVIGGVLPPEIASTSLPAAVPLYPKGPHCNPQGLTELGEYALRGMIERGMMVELDHMSAKAAGRALDILESERYPGAVSSHSWMSDSYMERLYALGGFATQYGHTAEEYVDTYAEKAKPLLDKYGAGYGFGSDMNGFGGTPAPPGEAAEIEYPFTTPDGTVVDRQVTGERTWDYNAEGVSHYGMLPDWLESVGRLGGQELTDDLLAGSESYLRTWGATLGYAPGQNLARGGDATAGSTKLGLLTSHAAPRASDGSTSTAWTATTDPNRQWWRTDLRTPRAVSTVRIDWGTTFATVYDVKVSLDGTSWTTAATVGDGNGGLDTVRIDPTSARFVRIDPRGASAVSLREVGVFS